MTDETQGLDKDTNPVNLMLPPYSLTLFTMNSCPDHIDYTKHPAYSEVISSAQLKDKIKSLILFGKHFFKISIRRILSYELIPAHLRKPKSFNDFFLFLKQALLNNYYKYFYFKKLNPNNNISDITKELNHKGICVVPLHLNHLDQINKQVEPLLDLLRKKRELNTSGKRDFNDSRSSALRTDNQPLFEIVEQAFHDSGILEGISQYLGRPARVIDINPQINDPSDDFWQHFFSDLNNQKPQTSYFHRDASGGDLKVIIYLSDVSKANGPFSFVLGSHKNRPSMIHNLIQEVNDTSGFSSPDLASRKSFAALPAFLRKKCSFGNDLINNSETSQSILGSQWEITANKGHAVLFDSKGIHRGGMVEQGERIVLTCVIG